MVLSCFFYPVLEQAQARFCSPWPAKTVTRNHWESFCLSAESKRIMTTPNAAHSGTVSIAKDLTVNRLGFGAMRITGEGIWGDPKDPVECKRVLKRLLDLNVNFIDTADSYGPEVSESLIA